MNKNKKTVGLITIHNIINFGSALQTYALSYVIEQLGYNCKVINYMYPNYYHLNFLTENYKPAFDFKTLCRTLINNILNNFIGSSEKKQKEKFRRFLECHLQLTKEYGTREEIHKDPPLCDIYVTGSDQVWNPRYNHEDTTFLLSFVEESKKKIAYSASFGGMDMPKNYYSLYKKYISSYLYISLREESGVKLVKELTGKDSVNVLDPSLLISGSEWSSLAIKPQIKEPYILCYLLSYTFTPFPYAYDLLDYIQKIMKCKVVLIGGANKLVFRHDYILKNDIGPEEFLGLFDNAAFVLTSSFHGTAFAINFNKPFYSIINDQKTTDDRQLSVMRRIGIENRGIVKGSPMPAESELSMDYTVANQKLQKWREVSLLFLKNALND